MSGEWRVGIAVHPHQFRGNSLPDLWVVFGFGQNHKTRVGVHVDEPRADDFRCSVDDSGSLRAGRFPTEDVYSFPIHAHGPVESRVARAIHDEAVVDQKVKQDAPYPRFNFRILSRRITKATCSVADMLGNLFQTQAKHYSFITADLYGWSRFTLNVPPDWEWVAKDIIIDDIQAKRHRQNVQRLSEGLIIGQPNQILPKRRCRFAGPPPAPISTRSTTGIIMGSPLPLRNRCTRATSMLLDSDKPPPSITQVLAVVPPMSKEMRSFWSNRLP